MMPSRWCVSTLGLGVPTKAPSFCDDGPGRTSVPSESSLRVVTSLPPVHVHWSFRSCCLQAKAAASARGGGSSGSFGRDNGSGTVPVEADMAVVRERLDAVVFSCRSVSVLAPLRMSEAAL